MTRADNSTLLRRSRDTLGVAPLPPPTPTIPLLRVILHVWGLTRADVLAALDAAAEHDRWDIAETVTTCGGPCPIPSGDRTALGQRAEYGWAWAAHPVWSHA